MGEGLDKAVATDAPESYFFGPVHGINLSDEQAVDLIRCIPGSRCLPEVLMGYLGRRWQWTNGLILTYEGKTKQFRLQSNGQQFETGAFDR
jgi:hypothetical protein